eukprot:CAMPEP_0206437832 /NCGR_PEP_ID=MMETSP0324_2-20121206/11264_1 /ASSEMBLY_ACC=CAM_ASM_000836 /TAXON_ID=2866 /ORGANISM="Crypthecodinium cohnii, Strain Seligo" /LENGTH=556 /DNA_ID=CAMNT_0053905165 /DNA_START=99 /DNA_END=1770 /DNA_ORIENTATION=+
MAHQYTEQRYTVDSNGHVQVDVVPTSWQVEGFEMPQDYWRTEQGHQPQQQEQHQDQQQLQQQLQQQQQQQPQQAPMMAMMMQPQPQGWVPVPVYMWMPEGNGCLNGNDAQPPCMAMGPFYDETNTGMPNPSAMVTEMSECFSIRTPTPDLADSYVVQAGRYCDMAPASCVGRGSMASTTESERLSEPWVSEDVHAPSVSSNAQQQQQQHQQQPHAPQGSYMHHQAAQGASNYYQQQMAGEAAEYHQSSQDSMAPATAHLNANSRRRRRPIRTNAPVVPLRVARGSGNVGQVNSGSSSGRGPHTAASVKAASAAAAASKPSRYEELRGNVLKRAFEPAGSRAVQDAIAHLNRNEASSLASELRGSVQACVESPHANYVLSCAIEQLPSADVFWVVEELLGDGVAVAVPQNTAGCQLVDSIVGAAVQLARNEFGRHTIIKLLEQGNDARRSQVAAALLTDLTSQARHRNASYVVESALEHAPEADREELVANLMRPEELVLLAQCQSGCHVIRSLLNTCSGVRPVVEEILTRSLEVLANSKYGQLLLRELGLLCNTGA